MLSTPGVAIGYGALLICAWTFYFKTKCAIAAGVVLQVIMAYIYFVEGKFELNIYLLNAGIMLFITIAMVWISVLGFELFT